MADVLEKYILEEKLGQGTSGQVYKGKTKETQRPVAIKFIPKRSLSSAGRENLINEISALKKLKHKFIIQMIDFSWNEKHVYIVMEFANSGDLSAFIKKRKGLSESVARIFCQQLCSALLFMREHNISHMDLKPSNLLLHRPSPQANPILKVADFGFAQNHDGTDDLGVRGSPLYMAPEIVLTKHYSPKVDIWSVGVILFEALFARAPYSSQTVEELINKIKEDKPVIIPRDRQLSDNCRRFLSSCLQRDPDQRIDFKELQKDPFLDLELSIPHEHSVEKMLELEELAASSETVGNLKEAAEHYQKSLNYARTLYYYAEEDGLRQKWRSSVKGYQRKLYCLAEETGPRRCPLVPSSAQQTTYSQLVQLCKVTPGLRDGVEICLAARNYQMEGDIDQAVDRYTAGLGVLVPLLQSEPRGLRRDLLHDAVKLWLQQAEALKASLEARDNKLQGMEACSTDGDKQCTVM